MKRIRNYVRPQTLQEAYDLNQKKSNMIVGGMLWTKMAEGNVQTAIDLCNLGLGEIEETDTEFRIGAMATLRMIEQHEGLNKYSQFAVRNAVKDIVGVQFRNMATVGGSIWGRFGFSDVLTVFLGMDAYVELFKGGIVPLSTFVTMPRDRDILVHLIIRKTPIRIVYQAVRIQRTDFPVLTCAAIKNTDCVSIVIGARPNKAMLIQDTEGILADGINESSVDAFAEYVVKNVPTGSNTRGSAEYRSHLTRVLTKRCIMELEETK